MSSGALKGKSWNFTEHISERGCNGFYSAGLWCVGPALAYKPRWNDSHSNLMVMEAEWGLEALAGAGYGTKHHFQY